LSKYQDLSDNSIAIYRNPRLLQLRILLSPLLSNLFFAELPRLALQHLNLLFKSELHLITHWYQAAGKVLVVLAEQCDGEHEIVDVVEHKCMFVGVLLFLRKEGNGVITPMTKRVEVVGCVVAIVVAVTVALLDALGYVFRIELAHDLPAHQ
jgi:hypothetical protein